MQEAAVRCMQIGPRDYDAVKEENADRQHGRRVCYAKVCGAAAGIVGHGEVCVRVTRQLTYRSLLCSQPLSAMIHVMLKEDAKSDKKAGKKKRSRPSASPSAAT